MLSEMATTMTGKPTRKGEGEGLREKACLRIMNQINRIKIVQIVITTYGYCENNNYSIIKNSHKISIKIKVLALYCKKKQQNEDVHVTSGLAMV